MAAFSRLLPLVSLFALTAGALSCGSPPGLGSGGGGDDDPPGLNDTGELSLSVEKKEMDSGDFNRIRVQLYDINENGVILKFRYPSSIKYSKESAVVFPREDEQYSISPYTEATSGKDRYLVFFISPEMALDEGVLPLEFDLKAITQDKEAFLQADIDNNDPRIDDDDEFRVSTAKFTALEHADIVIADESTSQATKTPTSGTPAATATPTG